MAASIRAAPVLADVGHRREQFAGLARVDHNAGVNDLRDFRRLPAQPVQWAGRQFSQFYRVTEHVGEDGSLARDCRGTGRAAILPYGKGIKGRAGMLRSADLADRK